MSDTDLISGKLVDPNLRADLRRVYLNIYDGAIVTEIPDIAAELGLKRRYVNELVGLLERIDGGDGVPLVVVNSSPGEDGHDSPNVYYQTARSVDDEDRKSAEFRFDFYVPANPQVKPEETAVNATKKTASATKPNNNPADLPLCKCGCGFPVTNRARNYLPGHDARHAGQVARAMAAIPGADNEDKRTAMLDALPTDALRWKAAAMADRLIAKGAAAAERELAKAEGKATKTAKVEKVTMEAGKVKVGRWWYPAERNSQSGAVTYTRKGSTRYGKAGADKVEVANDKVAATFVKEA